MSISSRRIGKACFALSRGSGRDVEPHPPSPSTRPRGAVPLPWERDEDRWAEQIGSQGEVEGAEGCAACNGDRWATNSRHTKGAVLA
jgi:hypothetical protein